MKRVFVVILLVQSIIAFSLILSVTAIADESDNQKKLEIAKKYVAGTNLGIVAMNYTNITENDAQDIGIYSYETYKETGKSNRVLKVWLLNSSDKVININPLNFKVTTEKGHTIPLSKYTYKTRNPFPAVRLKPQAKIDGFIVFGLGLEDNILQIIYDDGTGNRVTREYKDALVLGFYERDLKKLEQSKQK
jgi:hypothetical protein